MGITTILAPVGWWWPEGQWGSTMQDPSSRVFTWSHREGLTSQPETHQGQKNIPVQAIAHAARSCGAQGLLLGQGWLCQGLPAAEVPHLGVPWGMSASPDAPQTGWALVPLTQAQGWLHCHSITCADKSPVRTWGQSCSKKDPAQCQQGFPRGETPSLRSVPAPYAAPLLPAVSPAAHRAWGTETPTGGGQGDPGRSSPTRRCSLGTTKENPARAASHKHIQD